MSFLRAVSGPRGLRSLPASSRAPHAVARSHAKHTKRPAAPTLIIPFSSHFSLTQASRVGAGVAAVAAGGAAFSSGEDHVEPPAYPWSHSGPFSTFDASA